MKRDDSCYDNMGYMPDEATNEDITGHTGTNVVKKAKCLQISEGHSSSYSNLLRCSQRRDVLYRLLGIALAVLAGIATPVTNVAYSEAVNMMMDSQHPHKVSASPMLLVDIIGGTRVTQNGTREERMDALTEYLMQRNWFIIGLNVMQLLSVAAAVALLKIASSNQARRIREQLFTAAMRHDMTWFDVKGGQNISANLNEEVGHIENGVGSTVAMMTLYMVNILVGLFISAWLSWKLTLVVGTIVPLNILLVFLITHLQNDVALKEVELSSDAGNVFTEAVSKIRTVASFGGEKKEVAKYENFLKQASTVAVKRGVFLGCVTSLTWIFNYAASIVAFIYGAQLLNEGESVLAISMVLASVWIVTIRFGSSFPLLQKISTAVGSSISVFRTIDAPHGIDPMAEGGMITSAFTGKIDFRNVHFRYPARTEVPVLTGVNFFVRPGETIAIVGPSGSGKSTILQLLQRFYDPQNGSIDIEGVSLKMLNVAWVRQQIGVVGQEAALFAGTIWDNIRFGLMTASKEDIIAAAKMANAHDFIMNLQQGYDTVIGSKGATLSGGEKQRVAIARALVRNPRILLLDEPTSALDAVSRDIVHATLKTACKGRTTLLVTHRLASTKTADRIIVIDGGKVVEEGTHSELMARSGIYSQMSLCEDKLEQKGQQEADEGDCGVISEKIEQTSKSPKRKSSNTLCDNAVSVPFNVLLLWNKPEVWLLIGGFVASAISGALMPIGAVIYGEFIGSFSLSTVEAIQKRVLLFTIIEVVVLIVMALSVFCVAYLFTVSRERLTDRLKIQAFSTIIQQELGWFDNVKNHVGALYSRVSRDVSLIHDFTGPGIGTIIQAVFNLSVGFSISMYYSWKLTLMTELIIPFLFMGPVLEGIMSKKEDSLEMAHLETACTIATEAMANKHVVTSLGLEKIMINRYNEALEGSTWRSKMSAITRGLAFGMAQSLPGAAFAICFAYGGTLIRDDDLPFESVVKVSEILLIGTWTVASELVFTASYSRAQDAAGRLHSLLTRTSAIKGGIATQIRKQQSGQDKITYSKITMSYPTRPNQTVLQDLDMSIAEGESIGVIGPSGSGKSSILHLLQRLYVPSNGSVSLHGSDVQNLTLPTLRHHLGLVSQEPTLFSGTIRENIAYGDNTRDVPIDEIVSAAKKANIHNFIVELPAGYETMLGKCAQLSGGQKQRIAIARALVRDPKVLLLDEATSALDPESERVVQEALNLAAKGRTTITIAHRMGAVALADRIIRIEGGRICEEKVQSRL